MAIAYRQSVEDVAGTVTTANKAYGSNVTAASILIVGLRIGATGRTVTVSDSVNAGNYTQAVTQAQTTDGHQSYIYYHENAGAGATTVTVSISGVAAPMRFIIHEYSGLATSSSLDKTNSNQVNGSPAVPDSGNVTTTQAAELLFGVVTDEGPTTTWTAASSGGTWNIRTPPTGSKSLMCEDLIVAGTGTYDHNPTTTLSSNVTSLIATFKASGAAVAIPRGLRAPRRARFTASHRASYSG